jgi:hypothetical protein
MMENESMGNRPVEFKAPGAEKPEGASRAEILQSSERRKAALQAIINESESI